jgi:hypothetical protein
VTEYAGTVTKTETVLPFVNVYGGRDGTGSLLLEKAVTGGAADEEYVLTVSWEGWSENDVSAPARTLALMAGQTAEIDNIPAGAGYTVTGHTRAGYTAAVKRASGVIAGGAAAKLAFSGVADPAGAAAPEPEETETGVSPAATPGPEATPGQAAQAAVASPAATQGPEATPGREATPTPGPAYEAGPSHTAGAPGGGGTTAPAGEDAADIPDTPPEEQDIPRPETTTLSGQAAWESGAGPAAEPPEKVTVRIRDGAYVAKQVVATAADNWQWSVDLPRYDAYGEEIQYTADTNAAPGYARTAAGLDATYAYTGGKRPDNLPPLMAVCLTGIAAVWRRLRIGRAGP